MNITKEQFKKLAKKHLTALQGYDVDETIEIYGVGKLYDEIVGSENTDLNSVCECEPHTFYEWEKDENKCCQCNKPICKQAGL